MWAWVVRGVPGQQLSDLCGVCASGLVLQRDRCEASLVPGVHSPISL